MDLSTLRRPLKAADIGYLEKHLSNDISPIAQTLLNDWSAIVDKGVKDTPTSVNSFIKEDEEGLPSPPLDEMEEALFAIQHVSMDLSGFFDDLDDDGNPLTNRKLINEPNLVAEEDNKIQQETKNEATMSLIKPLIADSILEPKKQQHILKGTIPRKPLVGKLMLDDDAALEEKLEATRRKLKERYQQAENAKRKRIVKVIQLCDLPKQGLDRRIPLANPRNRKRQRANGRR